ncbi:MAG TPA: DUF4382 domain-containing protein [Steroidobacteraceae bacterium]|nr:DUF4382 domain-containing protein [Steroidobacteraceae bacterium]
MTHATTHGHQNGTAAGILQRLRQGLLALAAATLAACGGGSSQMGGTQGSSCSDCGTALLTVTDAPGDFLSYAVDVTSLQLRKANGTLVQAIPATARIDFAQLVDLSEVLSAGEIPSGEYVAATLGVDFSNADIVVDDGTGNGVQVSPVDAGGHALGHVDLTVQLDNRHHLVIDRQRVSQLAFDMDIAASNTVDLNAHTVTVSPFIVASVQRDASRQVRARGRLASVDVAGSSYSINVRPFEDTTDSSGQLVVHTTASTHFEINGMVSSGADGLTQLAALTGNPVTIAFGSIDATTMSFTATRVLAASSAEDLQLDYLSGNVLARSGDTLTIGGVRVGRHGGRSGFELGHVGVTVATGTRVTSDGQGSGALDIGAISVGQRIEAYGVFSGDGTGHASLDATAGRVRLNYTHLYGTVAATAAGSVTLALQNIDGRDPAHFDFSGTGSTTANDADPAHYVVSTGSLPVTGLANGAYTRLFGFVTPFGAAPPDFTADTFVDFTDTHASTALNWGINGSTAPFSASSGTSLTLNLGSVHGTVRLGGRLIDVTTLAALSLQPAGSGMLTFAIYHRTTHDVDNFSNFADFETQLAGELNGTTVLYSLAGEGTFDAAAGVLTAQRLLVVVGD